MRRQVLSVWAGVQVQQISCPFVWPGMFGRIPVRVKKVQDPTVDDRNPARAYTQKRKNDGSTVYEVMQAFYQQQYQCSSFLSSIS